jgi:hypothetical protein
VRDRVRAEAGTAFGYSIRQMRKLLSLLVFTVPVLCVAADARAQAVPALVKRPAFVNDLSKRTDDLTSFLKRKAKKELMLVADETAAQLTIELVSVTKNVTGVKNVNQIASAIAGTVIMESGDSYTAVARVCIPAKSHCEEFTDNATYDWQATWGVGDKVKKFVKDNAAAVQP